MENKRPASHDDFETIAKRVRKRGCELNASEIIDPGSISPARREDVFLALKNVRRYTRDEVLRRIIGKALAQIGQFQRTLPGIPKKN